MKKDIFLFLIAVLLLLSVQATLNADSINGYLIPEYYMVSGGNQASDGQHGFWMRRIYFGYDTDLGDGWSARVRLEMNGKAFASDKMSPYVKNAHVQKKLSDSLSLIAGIVEPPSFNAIEKFWGLRQVEKTAPDLFKFASSRDFAAGLDGKTKSGLVYSLMYGNYSGEGGDANKGKAVYGRIGYDSKSLFLEANAHRAAAGGKDVTYLSLFAGLRGDWGRVGAGYSYKQESPAEGEDKDNGAISALAAVKIGKNSELYARYDHLTDLHFNDVGDFLPIQAKENKARLLMAGLRLKLHKMIELIPNVKYVFYGQGEGGKPDADFHILLTGMVSFKSEIL